MKRAERKGRERAARRRRLRHRDALAFIDAIRQAIIEDDLRLVG